MKALHDKIHDKASLHLMLAAGCGLGVVLAIAQAPLADWALNGLSGAAALIGAVIAGTRLVLDPPSDAIRRFWQLALALLLLVGLTEFAGSWIERVETRLGIEDLNDCLTLLAALAALWFTTTLDHAPARARRLLWIGFGLQIMATALDLGDTSRQAHLFDPMLVESAIDLLQFLTLLFYLVGAVVFLAALRSNRLEAAQAQAWPGTSAAGVLRQSVWSDETRPVGQSMRRDFARYIARGSLDGFFRSRLYVEGARPIMFVIRTAWCLRRFGGGIAAAGRPLSLQAVDMLRLGWRDGIDPILYPTLELYRLERRRWADHALSRFEVGCGMLKRLHKVRPKPHGERVNLGDKLAFHHCCRVHRLPAPPILLHAKGGRLRWLDANGTDDLDRDLFIKPRQWRGARKSLWLRRIDALRWRTSRGGTWTRADLFDHLSRESRRRDLLLQPMLANHPAIADLADQSLIAIRVITCMDAGQRPVVTHAMLRVVSKLEPRWHSKRELAARIDLGSGRLGRLCNDKDLWPGCWSERHPVTGAPVDGRILSGWPEIRALAVRAHEVFSDRMLVGWDIALTPAGAVVLEGNSYPDVHFLQRVHEQPIGMSALGPLLQRALDATRVRDRHMIDTPERALR